MIPIGLNDLKWISLSSEQLQLSEDTLSNCAYVCSCVHVDVDVDVVPAIYNYD